MLKKKSLFSDSEILEKCRKIICGNERLQALGIYVFQSEQDVFDFSIGKHLTVTAYKGVVTIVNDEFEKTATSQVFKLSTPAWCLSEILGLYWYKQILGYSVE